MHVLCTLHLGGTSETIFIERRHRLDARFEVSTEFRSPQEPMYRRQREGIYFGFQGDLIA